MTAGLRSLLLGAAPVDDVEQGHLRAMLELAEKEGCTFRSRFKPGHFTASAFVLSPDGADLLLIHHSKLKRWLQPGGHVDPTDEDIEAAARREVEEEVGLTGLERLSPVPFDLDVHRIPARKSEPEHAHYDVRFLFRAPCRTVTAGSDAEAVKWVPLEAVSLLESDASVMRAVEKLTARG